jgi:hypothetical protein
MRRWGRWLTPLGFAALFVLAISPFRPEGKSQQPPDTPEGQEGAMKFCLLFSTDGQGPVQWDGSIRASGAQIRAVQGWRLSAGNRVDGSQWVITSERTENPAQLVENGVEVTADLLDPKAIFTVETAQGGFRFTPADIPFGSGKSYLGGRAAVERLPLTTRLTHSPEEQDYPVMAQSAEKVYLAHIEFTHGDRAQKWPRQLTERSKSYDSLIRPAGGDQVLLLEYDKRKQQWGPAQAVSQTGQDVCGAAIAVDGVGRLWAIWSANVKGNFDLYARYRQGRAWSKEIRLTQDPGPDLQPVAATDSAGAVWVVWQGSRGGNFDVLTARQDGQGFGPERTVFPSPANEWDPQIAAGPDGEVAVVWDTYARGDYDVYLRRLRYANGIRMASAVPVAASRKFESSPTAAYDASGRLWVAYEEQFRGWGKDFGAFETTGTGRYQPGNLRVKLFQNDRVFVTPASLDAVLNRDPVAQPGPRGQPRVPPNEPPNPEFAGKRAPNRTPYGPVYKSLRYPRLAADSAGTVYLAYRVNIPGRRTPLGSLYFENLAYFDGATWNGPVFAPASDGTLDNWPAVLATGPGRLLMASSTDMRFAHDPRDRAMRFAGDRHGQQAPSPSQKLDPYNTEIVLTELVSGAAKQPASLTEIAAEKPQPPEPDVEPEMQQVAMMRAYRTRVGSEDLRVLRGEFHIHTVISGDTDYRDGSLRDTWRYALDAAYMDWVGCCDHDNGFGREYYWWTIQKLTDAFHVPRRFVPMFSFERSVRYPEGHRNVIFAKRGIRVLSRLPRTEPNSPADPAPDTQMLYEYLRRFDGIASAHTSATEMGTDWRNNDPEVETSVEIYQGDRQNYEMPGAPRSNSADDSIGGWRPLGMASRALEKGYRLAFQASSDHFSTHMSYSNLWVTELTREAVLQAFKKRRMYGATDNILADVRANGHFMGEEFTANEPPNIDVKLVGTANFAKVHVIKDSKYVYTVEPRTRTVEFSWRDNEVTRGRTSYYYVRGEQEDGELVWVSPMWINVR